MARARLRVATLVGLVAIAALNFGAIRAWSQLRAIRSVGHGGRMVSNVNNTIDVAFLGGLPMANILVVALIVRRRRAEGRRFLLGFELFGFAALVVFLVCASLFTDQSIQPYVLSVLRPLGRSIKQVWPTVHPGPVLNYLVAALLLLWPQLAIALIGGAVCHSVARSHRRSALASQQ